MSDAHDCDVVVVGGGIAGLTAANRAAQQGLKAVLLERGVDERYLCNTRYSGGVIHIAFRNVKDRPEELMEAIQHATSGNADPALAKALASTCGRTVDWLSEEGAKFIRVGQIAWQQWVLAPRGGSCPVLTGKAAARTLRCARWRTTSGLVVAGFSAVPQPLR